MDNIIDTTGNVIEPEQPLQQNILAQNVSNIFSDYKVKATCSAYKDINHFNVYELELEPGCKIKSVEGIGSELQLKLKYKNKPVFLINDGKINMIFANDPEKIDLSNLLEKYARFYPTEIVFGIDYNGQIVASEINKMPHLLVAGSTGSGKSVFLHTIIHNFLDTARPVDFYLFDPKFVEFECYKNMKTNHGSFVYVHNTIDEIMEKLKTLHLIMEKRFAILAQYGCKNIKEFNKKMKTKMKYIFVIIDEFADLIGKGKDKKAFENMICTLAAKCRASGIHIILSTQRPSVAVVSGNIKNNFSTRVCFKVPTGTDSRVILDQNGAENLMGNGDGIFMHDGKLSRFQGAFVETD